MSRSLGAWELRLIFQCTGRSFFVFLWTGHVQQIEEGRLMANLTEVQKRLIHEVADLFGILAGAYNFCADGGLAGRNSTENIDICAEWFR